MKVKSRIIKRLGLVFLVCMIPAIPAFAGEATAESNAVAIDTVWTLIAAFLVFFMQAGFAMVETGFTRAKNAANIMMKNLMDFCVGSIVFWLVGFGVMFGASAFGLFGTSGFFLSAADPSTSDGLWQFAYWIFQAVFAATAATIVSGAMAERTKFSGYLIYSVFITALIYPVVGHWIWGGGWLASKGMIDFAGSTVVHSVGGWAALAGAIMLGPRLGKYNKDRSSNAIPGHNIPLAALGVFILWFGWFGFNAGSTTSGTNMSIATIAVTTNLAAAAGAILAMFTAWIRFGKPDTSMALNGALAGLVAITAPCASVSPLSAIIIGAIGGVLVVLSVEFIDKVLHVDDPVGAISVHGVCGAWGTLAAGLFAQATYGEASGVGPVNGLFFGGGLSQFFTQLIGVVSVFVWVFGAALLLFYIAKKTIGLRTSDEEQLKGLDIGEHGMEAYAGFQIFTTE
ncbi:MAG: ammonium transporter [Candidatus Omnitrophica bacterium]|nr:ammonium transporter [Candidatus Omnitrophota bacterium]MBU4458056.1 ammonium transporter [Candidatus Omnitrophota bacterium]